MAHVFDHLKTDWQTKVQLGFRALHQHELFHYAVDYMSAQWEAISEMPCYYPARKLKARIGYNPKEEMIANANKIRSFWGGGLVPLEFLEERRPCENSLKGPLKDTTRVEIGRLG
jgi:hypothetical protein